LEYEENNIFNVGTARETNINELYNSLCKAVGNNLEAKHGPAKEGEQFRSVISYKKIEKELGWKPTYTVDKGLEETIEFFRKYEVH